MINKEIFTGSDFCGVGSFDQALKRLSINQNKLFACDWDKYARQTYILNYGEPNNFPKDVYDREIPKQSLDIYVTSPPCQAFSMAGKREGEDDQRGILFYNSHEFIKVNRPRFFIFENVKGLLSHDSGKTFGKWIEYLGGKSINGNAMLFPHDESVPYHIYFTVLNAKEHGIPQNRERVFIVGIRDDEDNIFEFPKPEQLKKTLADCLEKDVDEKYFIDLKQIESLLNSSYNSESDRIQLKDYSDTLCSRDYKSPKCVIVKSNTKLGFEVLEVGEDSLNLDHPNSETRRGRVGKKVAQTLTTSCNQGVFVVKQERTDEAKEKRSKSMKENGVDTGSFKDKQLTFKEQDFSDTILANPNHKKEGLILLKNELNLAGTLSGGKWEKQQDHARRVYSDEGIAPTITTMGGGNTEPKVLTAERVRKLTPRECFRLMDYDDSFLFNVSDSQAYKQAGNSIPVGLLVKIIERLKL